MNVRGIGVAVVFLVGCAVGGVSGRLVVPKASAQQAATLTRWEYTCVIGGYDEILNAETLNPYGTQGWELVNHGRGPTNSSVCFKRPKM